LLAVVIGLEKYNMIIIKLIGGLGNQMFQYSLGRCLSEKLNCDLKLDINSYSNQCGLTPRNYELGVFKIKECFADVEEINHLKNKKRSFFQKLFGIKKIYYFSENSFSFDNEVLNLTENAYLEGYWQSEKYFKRIEKILKTEFVLKNEMPKSNKEFLEQIKCTNSVSLHVRRGDYISDPIINEVHGVCGLGYYRKAVNYIAEKVDNPHFFVFSDDKEWVKNNLLTKFPTIFVNCNHNDSGHLDMMLISNCKHHICANSSFSWWGAWLGKNDNKIVIAPQKWFNNCNRETKDLIPNSWIKL